MHMQVKEAAELPRSSRTTQRRSKAVFTAAQAVEVYRLMLLSRRIDDLEVTLKRQNKIYFQISCAGHEAALAAASMHLRAGHDWFFPYYRDRTLCLGLGVTPLDMLLQAVGAASDVASGGRQMPSHWSSPAAHIVAEASTTGTQFLSAVGCAEGAVRRQRLGHPAAAGGGHQPDEVVYCSAGEGATSQGAFYEALNTACVESLPVLFHIEDNGYAISVPVADQMPGGNITRLLAGYPNLLRLEFDGCDPEACYRAFADGVAHARARRGPVVLHSHVVRCYSHSLSDDESAYRPAHEIEGDQARDPLPRFRRRLLANYKISEAQLGRLEGDVEAVLATAEAEALAAAAPTADSAQRFVFSPDVDPRAESLAVAADADGPDLTLVDAINRTLADEMAHNPNVLVFGEDVADAADDARLAQVRGKGGVFKATFGLQRRFGATRVFNTPLSEANIIGRAMGLALRGFMPVMEIQFFDYIWPAMMHLRSEICSLRWRSHNGWAAPMVIRATYGGYLRGGAVYHSQTGESIFCHQPGLRVVLPSCAADAVGLLRTAMRSADPVLFLEHKHLYRQPYSRSPYPGADYTLPFGRLARRRAGHHLTVVTYGAVVKRAMDAAAQASLEGIEVEVLDLRTLSPYDWPGIAEAVQRTGRVLVTHEESRSFGFGAEIAARIGEELFLHLDAPVRRVGSLDTFVGYHPSLEDAILPQVGDLLAAMRELAAY